MGIKPEVNIYTEGSGLSGYGHISRCMALSQALEEYGVSPFFIINAGKDLKFPLKKTRHIFLNWPEKLKCLPYNGSKPRISVIDSYKAGLQCYREITAKSDVTLYLDDFKRLNYPSGIILNASFGPASRCRQDKKGRLWLFGPRYALLRKEFWKNRPGDINKKAKNIIVLFGGHNIFAFRPDLVSGLSRDFRDKKITVVLPEKVKVPESCRRPNVKVVFSPRTPRLIRLMRDADVAISAGGQTLYELAALGVPTIAMILADNQSGNVLSLKKAGFLKNAGNINGTDLGKTLCAILKKLDYKQRLAMRRCGRACVDARGARRVAKILLKHAKNSHS